METEEGASSPQCSPWSLTLKEQYPLKFKGSVFAGFSPNDDILIADKNDPKSYMYLFHFNGETYDEEWAKLMPAGFKGCCDKVMCSEGNIYLQQCEDAVTVTYTRTMQHLEAKHYKGELLDTTEDGRAMYATGTLGESDWRVEVWTAGQNKPDLTLQPREGHVWKEWISICIFHGFIAVVENDSKSLDLFTEKGKHIFHKSLAFFPSLKKAITALGTRHIMVAELKPAALHVYAITGEEVVTFGREKLGLKGNIRILGIRYSTSSILHVAAGGVGCISMLMAFKVANFRLVSL